MTALLVQIFMGWPAIIGSLLISSIGIFRLKPYWLLGGAFLFTGFAWYLTASPAVLFQIAGYTLPLLHIAAMFVVRRGFRYPAALLLLPQVMVTGYILVAVLIQSYQ